MKRGFNPFELFDDVSKEITDSADTAIKTIQQGAVTFATSVSDAISGITETFNDSSNEQDNKKNANQISRQQECYVQAITIAKNQRH